MKIVKRDHRGFPASHQNKIQEIPESHEQQRLSTSDADKYGSHAGNSTAVLKHKKGEDYG